MTQIPEKIRLPANEYALLSAVNDLTAWAHTVEARLTQPEVYKADFHGEGLAELIKVSKQPITPVAGTPNLRSVGVVAQEGCEATFGSSFNQEHFDAALMAVVKDRAHIATVLIAGLEGQKDVTRRVYDKQVALHRVNEIDNFIDLIKATLTDVTSEEK